MSNISPSQGEPAWAAFAAIDWGSQNHFWALHPADGGSTETGTLPNTPEAIDRWAAELRQRLTGRPIALALEQKRGALIYMLCKYDHFILYPVPPSMSAAYRRTFHPSGAKNDPVDTGLILDLLLHHRERLHCHRPDTAETRLLHVLVEQRRHYVQEKVRYVQRLTDSVQQYFPQIRTWFGSLDTILVDDLLQRWPKLPDLQRSHPGTLRRFLTAHHWRPKDNLELDACIKAFYAAVPATDDAVVLEASTRKTTFCLNLLRTLRPQITEVEKRIAEIVADHPDAPIFDSFPGAGKATVPRLIAAFGTDRDAWGSAEEVQRFSGIAPVFIGSGKSATVVMRRACPKFLRQTFHEFAGQSIRFCPWAKAYYDHQRKDGKAEHHVAVRSLAYRWIRILFRCWKDRKPYNEAVFLAAQQRCHSPLRGHLDRGTKLDWQKTAGFYKLGKEDR